MVEICRLIRLDKYNGCYLLIWISTAQYITEARLLLVENYFQTLS